MNAYFRNPEKDLTEFASCPVCSGKIYNRNDQNAAEKPCECERCKTRFETLSVAIIACEATWKAATENALVALGLSAENAFYHISSHHYWYQAQFKNKRSALATATQAIKGINYPPFSVDNSDKTNAESPSHNALPIGA